MIRKYITKPAKILALTLGLMAGTTTSLSAATFNFNLPFVTDAFPNVPDPFGTDQPARASGTITFTDMPSFIDTFGPTITRFSGVGTEFTITIFDALDNVLGSYAAFTPFGITTFENSDQTSVIGFTDGFSFQSSADTGTGVFENTFAFVFFDVFLPTGTFDDQGLDNVTLDNIALGGTQPEVLTFDFILPDVTLTLDFDYGDDFVIFGSPIAAIPVPASLPLLAGGLGLFAMAAR